MFRYWDGQSWSEQTTSDASAPPPGPAVPPPPAAPTQMPPQQYGGQQYPQQYGQDPYAQQQPAQPQPAQYGGGYGGQDPYGQGYPGAPGGSGGGTGKRVGLIALAVLLIAGLAVGGFFLVRTLTDDDGDSSADDDSSQTEETDDSESPTEESPTESSTEESPTEPTETAGPASDPCTGGAPTVGGEVSGGKRLLGGNLNLPPVRGFNPLEAQIISTFTFADEVAAVGRSIEEGWIALYSVGALPKDNGYTDLAASADQVITCMTESPSFYRNFTERTDLDRESIQVDGHDAYSVSSELRIDDPDIQVEGDVARVVVVDTGDEDSFGLYVSVVPIGDQGLINQQDAATQELTVDD